MAATLPLASVAGPNFAGAAVTENVPLAELTTLRIGPVAARLITCDSTAKLADVASALPVGDDVLVLAGGSNVVMADDLTGLTVIAVANTGITVEGAVLRAEAGAVWDDVVATALAHGLGGLECLSGIPGSAGATPIQNVGAYGAEVADTITAVRLLDRATGADEWVRPDEAGLRLPAQRAQVPVLGDRAGGRIHPGPGRAAARRCATANWPPHSARSPGRPRTRRGCGRRCWRCAAPRAWCSTPRRPRHLERRLLLHQPGGGARGVRAAARAGTGPGAALSGAGRGETGRRVAGRAGRFRQGISRARRVCRACPPNMRWP